MYVTSVGAPLAKGKEKYGHRKRGASCGAGPRRRKDVCMRFHIRARICYQEISIIFMANLLERYYPDVVRYSS